MCVHGLDADRVLARRDQMRLRVVERNFLPSDPMP
eukprot:SAG31_NODE_13658_length_854_cov_80.468874_2_plen_34_part_01